MRLHSLWVAKSACLLQAKAPVFSAPVVTLAFNIASFSYGDKLGCGGQPLMVCSPHPWLPMLDPEV